MKSLLHLLLAAAAVNALPQVSPTKSSSTSTSAKATPPARVTPDVPMNHPRQVATSSSSSTSAKATSTSAKASPPARVTPGAPMNHPRQVVTSSSSTSTTVGGAFPSPPPGVGQPKAPGGSAPPGGLTPPGVRFPRRSFRYHANIQVSRPNPKTPAQVRRRAPVRAAA
jgi:hypothetical protein